VQPEDAGQDRLFHVALGWCGAACNSFGTAANRIAFRRRDSSRSALVAP
jgi:hypothetical protein